VPKLKPTCPIKKRKTAGVCGVSLVGEKVEELEERICGKEEF